MLLTYVATIDPPGALPDGTLVGIPVGRSELARGGAMAPPSAIGVAAVLEHALRHLAWLVHDDPAIATALSSWKTALAQFAPEPFRAIG
ncbi:MAG: hypothetical protein ABI334_02735 [Candidatus Dormiibacterota bacterium]